MLIEIHMIQNHSPSNLNRDDLGAPKTCFFGGATRARISSQCLKRSIRNPGNPDDLHNREPGMFAQAMKGHLGFRTKLFPWLVAQVLDDPSIKRKFLDLGVAEEHYERSTKNAIVAACKTIARKEGKEPPKEKTSKRDDRPQTPQLIFLGPGHAKKFIETLLTADNEHREHFLDPATVFESVFKQELTTTSLTDKQRERALEAAWRIRHTEARMAELRTIISAGEQETEAAEGPPAGGEPQPADENQPGADSDEAVAKLIADGLDRLAAEDAKGFESVTSSKGRKGEPRLETKRDKPKKYGEFLDSLAAIHSGDAVDIALFGRMTTSDAFQDVEAAMQVAHAISTHATVNEVDYFTAVDDLGKAGGGAAHVDEAMFNSACFYKYFSLDWDQLVYNLAGPEPDQKANAEGHGKWKEELKPHAERLAAAALGHFLRAAAQTSPSGKQNSFASNCDPCGILVEIKKSKTPTSYANAFAEPVERIGKPDDDAPDETSLEGRSVACLADHVQALRRAYAVDSNLLWFSRSLSRFPFHYWDRSPDGKKLTSKPLTKRRFEVLDELVEAVVRETSELEWADVCKWLSDTQSAAKAAGSTEA